MKHLTKSTLVGSLWILIPGIIFMYLQFFISSFPIEYPDILLYISLIGSIVIITLCECLTLTGEESDDLRLFLLCHVLYSGALLGITAQMVNSGYESIIPLIFFFWIYASALTNMDSESEDGTTPRCAVLIIFIGIIFYALFEYIPSMSICLTIPLFIIIIVYITKKSKFLKNFELKKKIFSLIILVLLIISMGINGFFAMTFSPQDDGKFKNVVYLYKSTDTITVPIKGLNTYNLNTSFNVEEFDSFPRITYRRKDLDTKLLLSEKISLIKVTYQKDSILLPRTIHRIKIPYYIKESWEKGSRNNHNKLIDY